MKKFSNFTQTCNGFVFFSKLRDLIPDNDIMISPQVFEHKQDTLPVKRALRHAQHMKRKSNIQLKAVNQLALSWNRSPQELREELQENLKKYNDVIASIAAQYSDTPYHVKKRQNPSKYLNRRNLAIGGGLLGVGALGAYALNRNRNQENSN